MPVGRVRVTLSVAVDLLTDTVLPSLSTTLTFTVEIELPPPPPPPEYEPPPPPPPDVLTGSVTIPFAFVVPDLEVVLSLMVTDTFAFGLPSASLTVTGDYHKFMITSLIIKNKLSKIMLKSLKKREF